MRPSLSNVCAITVRRGLECHVVSISAGAGVGLKGRQNLDANHKETLISTFRRAAQTSAPYREFIECCQSDSKHSR